MGYMGSKSGAGVYQAIVALMPPHDTYIEPFVGSGVILKAKAPAPSSIVIDLDADAPGRQTDLPGVFAMHANALTMLPILDYSTMGRVLVYADPPYVLSTRGAGRYAHDFTDADHRQLAIVLHELTALGVAVILSGYPSPLYEVLFPDWNTREFQAMTRGGVRTEKVWFNFQPDAAHWSTFAGRNFTDRQRIKRKAARWKAHFTRLPAAERQAVLAALMEDGDRS